nr:MAG TPA: hypothetical protein [Bacteriophage sp.]
MRASVSHISEPSHIKPNTHTQHIRVVFPCL